MEFVDLFHGPNEQDVVVRMQLYQVFIHQAISAKLFCRAPVTPTEVILVGYPQAFRLEIGIAFMIWIDAVGIEGDDFFVVVNQSHPSPSGRILLKFLRISAS